MCAVELYPTGYSRANVAGGLLCAPLGQRDRELCVRAHVVLDSGLRGKHPGWPRIHIHIHGRTVSASCLVLAGTAGAGGMVPPASTRIPARMKRVREHSSRVNIAYSLVLGYC